MNIDWMPTDLRTLKEYYALSQALLDQVRKAPVGSEAGLTGVETYVDPATGDGEEAFTQWATKFRDATPQERAVMLEQEEV